ncbi:MAG: hypothetical protein F6K19_33105 [Cyanothece sp. SIO1E1]|nr:hypothetical protein [Cyanothece sp. SIO1E1]
MPESISENRRKYHALLNQLTTAAIACTPSTWTSGTLIIERDGESISCLLENETASGQAQMSEELRSLCHQFSVFKRSSSSESSWSKAIVNYVLGDRVDFSVQVHFEYPNNSWAEVESEPLPDESGWRRQTQDFAWQQSPSLLVMEFIMDYRLWNDSAVNRSDRADFSEAARQPIQIDWQKIIDKFCLPGFKSRPLSYNRVSRHGVAREAICSAETIADKALVRTIIQTEIISNGSVETHYEYALQRLNNRWFLTQIYSISERGRYPHL